MNWVKIRDIKNTKVPDLLPGTLTLYISQRFILLECEIHGAIVSCISIHSIQQMTLRNANFIPVTLTASGPVVAPDRERTDPPDQLRGVPYLERSEKHQRNGQRNTRKLNSYVIDLL